MYAYFQGTLTAVTDTAAVVECSGIGYRIFAPKRFLESAPVGERVKLYTHLIVREDELSLYGFESEEGRMMFERLIGVSGVGPKVGLSILSLMQPSEVARAILAGDNGAFTKANGVGKKTAERILMELRDKLDPSEALAKNPVGGEAPSAQQEAAEALVSLGYQKAEAVSAVHSVAALADTAEELILLALKRLDVR